MIENEMSELNRLTYLLRSGRDDVTPAMVTMTPCELDGK